MRSINAQWQGPFSWPGYEDQNGLLPIPSVSGVYLQTFEYLEGFLIYAAGITRRPAQMRFREHTRSYMCGNYNVLDVAAAQKGKRETIWRGWGYAREHRDEFEARKDEIIQAVQNQLRGFRIFVASVGNENRVQERLEAAIMHNLYGGSKPICDLPDRGMQLSARWADEDAILVQNKCSVLLHGLPEHLEI